MTLDAASLLSAIGEVWPADGPRVSLNLASEALLLDVLNAPPANNLMIEVPSFMAGDAAHAARSARAHANGNSLLLKGRPLRANCRAMCCRASSTRSSTWLTTGASMRLRSPQA